MDVATWNVNSLRPRLDHLLAWLDTAKPDVVCLQETKVVDEDFPGAPLREAGWSHQLIHGQKTYNGVAILSRHPLEDPVVGFLDGEPDPQARLVRATVRGVRIVNCYVPNGAPLGSDKYAYKIAWYRRLRAELDAHHDAGGDLLLCGDMNVAPDDADVYDPFEAQGQVLTSAPEREALQQLVGWGLTDAFRKKNPFKSDYSWWDYRGSAFRHNHGFRIDHIYLTRSLLRRCASVRIDREPRTWERPSDHTPVVATLREPG
ncbi:MAG: exodeoxyribonuclease III [Alphaproteobacteria bacterium]|nr:exodeoxyribonuclease III [Alphaproteobacteria bacterium]